MKQFKWTINDTSDLYQCFIPFIERGGLFIPSKDTFEMGEVVELQLTFSGKEWCIEAPVVWITPEAAINDARPAGVGLQFKVEHENLYSDMQTQLVGFNGSAIDRFVF